MVEGYRVMQHQYKAFLLRCMLSVVKRGRSTSMMALRLRIRRYLVLYPPFHV